MASTASLGTARSAQHSHASRCFPALSWSSSRVKHLDLFSGIGGFAIAAQRVGLRTIGFCDIDAFCIGLLRRRFDRVRWFSLPGHLGSGEAAGIVGIEELSSVRPTWLVIENDYHRWRAWVPELRSSLYR